MSRILMWSARILNILFAAFLAIFSLDSFETGFTLMNIAGFFIHNIPSLIILALLWLAWKRPVYGGVGFVLAGIFAFFFFGGLEGAPFTSGPAFLIGALYIASHYIKRIT